ncbi:MAG: sugar-binding protein [Armatimonadota bacterium]|nr:sugar-binding protein [Armatimonadota bacterium]
MRTAPTVAVALILTVPVRPVDASSLLYPCFRADAPPVIDGERDDPCWQSRPLATGFSVLGDGFTEDKQTAFRACWDESALYFLIVCEEPDVGHLTTDVRDGGPAWLNDGVEIFLQPSDGGQVYQFVVTAAAARATGAGAADFRKVEAAAGTEETSYALEIAIPHGLVRAEPSVGDTWGGNVCRNIWTTISGGDKFTCWAPLQRQFLEPQNFAVMQLRGVPPADETLAAITRDLNRRYREHLVAQLQGVAAQAPRYLAVLERARDSEDFAGSARRLCYGWYRMRRMQRSSERYSIQDLREMVQTAEELLAASYELKYAYLIAGLFPD